MRPLLDQNMSDVAVKTPAPEILRLNRASRRRFRRLILAQHRSETRSWRRAWRGIHTQSEIGRLASHRPTDYPGAGPYVRRLKVKRKAAKEGS